MQETITYAGQLDCYERTNEVIKHFLNVEIGHTQAHRVTDTYGKELGKNPVPERTMPPVKEEEILYVEADGSMLLTREESWKEVKLGRVFKSGDCIKADGKVGFIHNSQYLAHLGSARAFTAQMDELIESYGRLGKRLVFISDGATWIRNWIEDSFPQAESILDYYHASEHLHAFAQKFFTDEKGRKKWCQHQLSLLLQSKVGAVIDNIDQLDPGSKEARNLIEYYQCNKSRMDYKRYRQIGCGIIGSGAIESAHRTVVQKRMKLSGQRWSTKGAQNMLNLRVTRMNGQWNKVIELTKTDFREAA